MRIAEFPKAFLLSLPLLLIGASQVTKATAPNRRALIIGLDGTTGNQFDYAVRNQGMAPNFSAMEVGGIFAPCMIDSHPEYGGHLDPRCALAQSGPHTGDGYLWKTGPGWGSVLTGVDNSKTLIKDNDPGNLSVFAQTSQQYPTMMRKALDHGILTAAGGVANFMTAIEGGTATPGVIDYECGSDSNQMPLVQISDTQSCNLTVRQPGSNDDDSRDENLTQFLKAQIDDPRIGLVMGVYDKIDATGHKHGFSSNQNYLDAIADADREAGELMAEVQKGVSERGEQWLVIVTSDHGGHNVFLWFGDHTTVEREDQVVPFVMSVYGTDQTLQPLRYPVSHLDVHPTVMKWFGLPTTGVDGQVQGLDP